MLICECLQSYQVSIAIWHVLYILAVLISGWTKWRERLKRGGRIDHTTFSSTPGGVLRGSWCFMGTGSEKLNTVTIPYNWIQFNINSINFNTIPLSIYHTSFCCGLWNGQHGFDWKAARSLDLPLMHEKHTSLADSSKPAATWMRLQPGDVRLQVVDRYLRFILWSPCPGLGSTWICMTSTTHAVLQGQHDRAGRRASFQCWFRRPPSGWCRCRGMISLRVLG